MKIEVVSEIKTWGNGNAVRLNKGLLQTAGLKPHDRVTIVADAGSIVIVKCQKKSLKEQLTEYPDYYAPSPLETEYLASSPVGKEVW